MGNNQIKGSILDNEKINCYQNKKQNNDFKPATKQNRYKDRLNNLNQLYGINSHDCIECLICMEVPNSAKITQCCHKVICTNCGPKLLSCPYRCDKSSTSKPLTKLFSTLNKPFWQNCITSIDLDYVLSSKQEKCAFCFQYFEENQIKSHENFCPQDPFRDNLSRKETIEFKFISISENESGEDSVFYISDEAKTCRIKKIHCLDISSRAC